MQVCTIVLNTVIKVVLLCHLVDRDHRTLVRVRDEAADVDTGAKYTRPRTTSSAHVHRAAATQSLRFV